MTAEMKSNDKKIIAKMMSGRTGKMKPYIAVLLVSVGKENFENEALKSAIKMINQEFKGCCIAVADTLQRYNIATEKNISSEQAYQESLQKGDEWLERYSDYFANTLEIPYEIIRWDSLILSPEFKEKETVRASTFKNNLTLTQSMDHSIEEYGERLQKRFGQEEFLKRQTFHKENCFSYLQEECIAISLLPQVIDLADDQTPFTIVYPGKSTAILTANREIHLKAEFNDQIELYKDYLNWLPYRFNKVKAHNSDELSKAKHIKGREQCAKSNISEAQQIDYVNSLIQAQIFSLQKTLDDSSIYEFNSYVLEILLGQNQHFHEIESRNFVISQSFPSKSLAYIFSTQMFAAFSTLEKKVANQCKANIVRILKRMNSNLESQFLGNLSEITEITA